MNVKLVVTIVIKMHGAKIRRDHTLVNVIQDLKEMGQYVMVR